MSSNPHHRPRLNESDFVPRVVRRRPGRRPLDPMDKIMSNYPALYLGTLVNCADPTAIVAVVNALKNGAPSAAAEGLDNPATAQTLKHRLSVSQRRLGELAEENRKLKRVLGAALAANPAATSRMFGPTQSGSPHSLPREDGKSPRGGVRIAEPTAGNEGLAVAEPYLRDVLEPLCRCLGREVHSVLSSPNPMAAAVAVAEEVAARASARANASAPKGTTSSSPPSPAASLRTRKYSVFNFEHSDEYGASLAVPSGRMRKASVFEPPQRPVV